MANFAIAASQETIEFASKIMEMYAQDGDKKEDTLLRILNLAERESVKGTHPELEDDLKDVDTTITTMIKQINGIVAGQDSQINALKKKLDEAIEAKRSALETMKAKKEEADAAVKKAESDVEMVKKQAQAEVKQANMERDQVLRERDDAKTIAAEKTANNDLLMRQMTAMEGEVAAYKALQSDYKTLQSDYSKAVEEVKKVEEDKKDAERDKTVAQNESKILREELDDAKKAQKVLSDANNDLMTDNKTLSAQLTESTKLAGDTALAAEQAANKAEKTQSELRDKLRQADKDNAKLSAEVEQLKNRIKELENNQKNDR